MTSDRPSAIRPVRDVGKTVGVATTPVGSEHLNIIRGMVYLGGDAVGCSRYDDDHVIVKIRINTTSRGALVSVNVADPDNPYIVGQWTHPLPNDSPKDYPAFHNGYSLFIDSNDVFYLVDWSDIANPFTALTIGTPSVPDPFWEFMEQITVRSDGLGAVGGFPNTPHEVRLFDASALPSLNYMGAVTSTNIFDDVSWMEFDTHDQLLVGTFTSGLQKLDVSNPFAPTSLGIVGSGSISNVQCIAIHDDYAYIGNQTADQVQAVRIFGGSFIVVIQVTLQTNPSSMAIDEQDGRFVLYVNESDGLKRYNVTVPWPPVDGLTGPVSQGIFSPRASSNPQNGGVAAMGGGKVVVTGTTDPFAVQGVAGDYLTVLTFPASTDL